MNIVTYIVIGKSDDFVSKRFQIVCPRCIILLLICFLMSMPVDLDTQLCLCAIEIYDEPVDGVLSAEFMNKVSISHGTPERRLRRRLRMAHFSCSL